MPVWSWVVVGVALWLALAAVAGLVIGRIIRARDDEQPRGETGSWPPPAGPDGQWQVPLPESAKGVDGSGTKAQS